MHDFLRTEWKTIVAVTVFCAVIYGWFYAQEREKKAEKDKPYVYSCFRPGVALGQYALGAEKSSVKLAGFSPVQSESAEFGAESFASPQNDIVLNFRNGVLAAIEFFPSRHDDEDGACGRDIEQFLKTNRSVSQDIPVADRTNAIYAGAVYISHAKPDAGGAKTADDDADIKDDADNEENADAGAAADIKDDADIESASSNEENAGVLSASAAQPLPDSWLIVRAR